MFCPKCGTLSYLDSAEYISCTNFRCGYFGPTGKVRIGNKTVNMGGFSTELEPESREFEVISDQKPMNYVGVNCPNCNEKSTFFKQEHNLVGFDDDKISTILMCKDCNIEFEKV